MKHAINIYNEIVMTKFTQLLNEATNLSLQELKELMTGLSSVIAKKELQNETRIKIKELAKAAGLSLQDLLDDGDTDNYSNDQEPIDSVNDVKNTQYTESSFKELVETKEQVAKPAEITSAPNRKPILSLKSKAKATQSSPAKPKSSSVKASISSAKNTLPASKYRNPENAMQEWTGRGAKPAWVKKLQEEGHELSDLEVR